MIDMVKKFASILIVFVLLFALRFSRVYQAEVKAANGSRVHNLNTGLNYTTIQEAINANETEDGHVIFAEEGTYYEHVTISKSISLVGEKRDTTVIDGNGTGTVIQITANNVSVINFTIRNAGRTWSGTGYPPSSISGNNIRNVNVTNNILVDAAVCAWFYSSSFVNISGNVILNATTAGIIGYASSNITIYQNFVNNCGWMGIHLDGNSANCKITDNTIMNTIEGIEIEKSAGNRVAGNQLANNNVSVVLNDCNGLNIFRENNMTSDWYNIIVWGSTLNAFMQDFDTTNIVNGKTVYYFTKANNQLINPSSCPNIGYLAIVNCTNVTIKDVDLSLNRDGLILAQSTNCSISNVTISGNRGPLLYGGLTLFNSSDNIIADSLISNNTVGICAYKSNGNTFYHNAFVDNSIHVISNFKSPFSQPSGPLSKNIWDNGYPGGGNYWSDYVGVDVNSGPAQDLPGSDGIGDTPYIIDADNRDHYPLMYPYGAPPPPMYSITIITTPGGTTTPTPGTYSYTVNSTVQITAIPNVGYSFNYWILDGETRTENPITVIMDLSHTLEAYFVDDILPEISDPWQDPPTNNVQPLQNVTVWVNVTDYGTGVKNVTLWYSIDNGVSWTILNMTALPIPSDTWITYEATIQGYGDCTWITYKIIAYDNAGNNATKDNNEYGYKYHVIPEYPSILILVLLMTATLTSITLGKAKRNANFPKFSHNVFS
jgi:parallel beta-helix repeat protein